MISLISSLVSLISLYSVTIRIGRLYNFSMHLISENTFRTSFSMLSAALITISKTRLLPRRKLTHSASLKEYRGTYAQSAIMEIVQCFRAFTGAVSMLKPSVEQAQSSATSTSSMMKWRLAGATLFKMSRSPVSWSLSQSSTATMRHHWGQRRASWSALITKTGSWDRQTCNLTNHKSKKPAVHAWRF